MKQRIEADINNAFTVKNIVSVYQCIKIDDCICAPETSSVSYDFWQLFYVDQGEYLCSIDKNVMTLSKGSLILVEPGQLRYTLKMSGVVAAIISFRCESEKIAELKNKVLELSADQRPLFTRIVKAGGSIYKIIPDNQDFFGQMPDESTADYELQIIKNQLELLLISLYEDQKQKRTPVISDNQMNYYRQQFQLIEEYMKAHLYENITVEDISLHTGFSSSTIKRICSKCVDCGAIFYFISLKIEEAKRLIRNSDQTITQIAENLGFSSVHYFSRIFKIRTGMSPKQYSKSM